MGETIAKQLAVKHVRELMANPEWAKVLYDYVTQLNAGEYPTRYVDALFQNHWSGGGYSLEDAYAFSQMHTQIRVGIIAVFQVPIGSEPVGDRQHDKMNSLLSALPYPFHGKFWGGTQGSDGIIGWERPVNAIKHREDGSGCGYVIAPPSTHVPIEVGTTTSEKSYLSFQGFDGPRALARWPYGQDRITVFTAHWRGLDEPEFAKLRENVWGSFESLPNPWDDWWK